MCVGRLWGGGGGGGGWCWEGGEWDYLTYATHLAFLHTFIGNKMDLVKRKIR